MKRFYVYILASKKNGTLYTGVTSNLPKRITRHKNKHYKGFTARYDVNRLVWYEYQSSAKKAIAREKEIKGWIRKKKLELIESQNPEWRELYFDVIRRSK